MARKGGHNKTGEDRHASNNKKGSPDSGSIFSNKKGRGNVTEAKVVDEEELLSVNQPSLSTRTDNGGEERKSKKKPTKSLKPEKHSTVDAQYQEQARPCQNNIGDGSASSTTENDYLTGENWKSPTSNSGSNVLNASLSDLLNGLDVYDFIGRLDLSDNMFIRRLKTIVLSTVKKCTDWLVSQKPLFNSAMTSTLKARDYVRKKIEHAYPIVLSWFVQFLNIMLLLLMVWLDCALRGMGSVFRMGTTSVFVVIWFGVLSLVSVIGLLKFFTFVVIAGFLGFLLGLAVALLFIAVSAIVFLWLYGSFWTTLLVAFFGVVAFTCKRERLALFIMAVYSVYCAWKPVGWFGLFLGLNFSFISSDALIFFLRSNLNENGRTSSTSEQTDGTQGGPGVFSGEGVHASSTETCAGVPSDRGQGAPSTSGFDSDLTSEDEVLRLLNSTDHYSALGFSRFEEVDVSSLKREYRKKAMLVHPDKNMGNERAAEAFKKLQNAYEVLLDSFKRKAYDDELRREDLLNYFRSFQNASQKNKRNGFFASSFGRTEADVDDLLDEARRIACRKCNSFHVWFYSKKSKASARWCQECKVFHQAKDGDGWVEQASQPFLFGMMQKVEAPRAYVCADSKIYDATEWYICQGMRCPPNTHKPSFYVNASMASKHTSGKASSSRQRGGGMPPPNMEETMTEEEFLEWLQNAMQAGAFENFDGSSPGAGNSSKAGANTGSHSSGKRKKGKR